MQATCTVTVIPPIGIWQTSRPMRILHWMMQVMRINLTRGFHD
jgi:hypothetical protein